MRSNIIRHHVASIHWTTLAKHVPFSAAFSSARTITWWALLECQIARALTWPVLNASLHRDTCLYDSGFPGPQESPLIAIWASANCFLGPSKRDLRRLSTAQICSAQHSFLILEFILSICRNKSLLPFKGIRSDYYWIFNNFLLCIFFL